MTESDDTGGTPEPETPVGKPMTSRQTSEGTAPLSFGQQRLWFDQQLLPTSPVYNVYQTWRIRGVLDNDALGKTLRALVRRHSALRTVVEIVDGAPRQVILEPYSVELPVEDLRGCSPEDIETICTEKAQEEVKIPFDLTTGPLLRAKLWRLGDEDHVLLLNMHHLITDGWTFAVIHREMGILYGAIAEGNTQALPDLPCEYGDYAVEQRKSLEAGKLDDQLGYWKKQLAELPRLQLPTDRSSSSFSSFSGACEGFSLGPALSAGLKSLSREEGVSLFTTLLASFKVFLSRYSGQTDIPVGTFKHGRTHQELEPLVGLFVNTLVLRTDLSGDPCFRELLQDVRKTCKGAFTHEELPFDRLVDELQPDRQLGRNPLFQASINYHAPVAPPSLPGLAVSEFTVGRLGATQLRNGTAKFDLELTWYDSENEVEGMIEYSKDVFDRSTIRRAIAHLRTLIEAAVADPERRVADLPLLDEAERRQLLVMGCGAGSEYPSDQCIHQLFERQVAERPQSIAVGLAGERVTYQELNARANQLARYLQQRGVGPEVMVGLCTERSLDMVVGLLGILKAGGAYVPLDPTYPRDRLAFVAKDAGLRLILTQEKFQDHLSGLGTEHIRLDADWPVIQKEEESGPVSGATPDSLAYVIYTSGSTGQPKGVQVTHANVVRLFLATEAWYHFDEEDVWTLFHSCAFDFSVWELWGALFYGGRVVIVPYEVSRSPEEFYELLVRERVTILNQTPSAFRQLIQAEAALGPNPNLALRFVIFGGEALDVQSLKPWFERHGDQTPRLVNMYGITETTVHVTYQPLSSEQASSGSVIGRPIPDLEVYVLDRNLEPVPVGVPGELYVGGAGVARGYLNRPDLTAERFIAHPFGQTSQARLYKTGDLGRYLPNGAIEYLGRIDHQVQLRGFRIELGEIEALLAQHPMVAETVATVREDEPDDKRLVAYVVPNEAATPSPGELKAFLTEKLPSYMVPGSFVVLERLPLTANGKVDKRALPAPDSADRTEAMAYVAPSNELEQRIARIWQEVLKLDQVGIRDNFFDLGGHSLLLLRVQNELEMRLGRPVSVLDLIQFPTIEALAVFLDPEARKKDVPIDKDVDELKSLSEGKRRLMRLRGGRQTGNEA